MKKLYNGHDPYAQAIASLVKKTLLVIAVFTLVLVGGISVVIIKANTKMSAVPSVSPKKELHTKITSKTEQLGAQTQEINNQTPLPSPQQTQQSTLEQPRTTPTPTSASAIKIQQKTITATAILDGYITQHGTVNTTSELQVGSTENTHIRSFISFDIKEIEAKKIKKAHLTLYQKSASNIIFQGGAQIKGDLIQYGSELDPGDYAKVSIDPSFILITNTANEGIRQIDITEAVMRTKNEGKNTIQIRLRLSDEHEYKNAYVSFESAENTLQTGNSPQLIIESIQ